jgi:hypothetical protein
MDVLNILFVASMASAFILIPLAYFRSGLAVILAVIVAFVILHYTAGIEPLEQNVAAVAIATVVITLITCVTVVITVFVTIAHWVFKKRYSKPEE